jgi:hypothetical protein
MSYEEKIQQIAPHYYSCDANGGIVDAHIPRWKAEEIATEADARIEFLETAFASLQEENSELRKDAERYRWLRQCNWFDSEVCVLRHPRSVLTRGGGGLGADCPSLYRLDEAIDTAITGAAK